MASNCDDVELEVCARTIKAKIARDVLEQARIACEEVDMLTKAALNQLPPQLKAMPARQALELFSKERNQGMHFFGESRETEMQRKLLSMEQIRLEIEQTNQQLEEMPRDQRLSQLERLAARSKSLA
eukprot:TRINITY_DN16959_c0_g1_i1.p1 TRINITY_DN16959_c0_g1~~TRINITY_DN16959_c0_g1_i1.p1  ORF type:complete len:144 (-),score=36.43 TRINITY_DN16959_c0_g1_i1:79-459(-)